MFHLPVAGAVSLRARAFEQRMKELAPEIVLHDVPVSRPRIASAYARARELFTPGRRPAAVFCTTDEIAYGVARHLCEIGLTPGRDVMISGFDGNPVNAYLAPWLISVSADPRAMAAAACERLQAHLNLRLDAAKAPALIEHRILF